MMEPIDIASLLRPVGAGGAGVDLRLDPDPQSPYQLLRNARAEARAAERLAAANASLCRETALADWQSVKQLCQVCLAAQSKDFQIAAWLMEALVRVDGLAGLAAGADLVSDLLDRYWHNGFPQEEPGEAGDEALARRAAPFEAMVGRYTYGSLEGTILQPLSLLPLFHVADGAWATLGDWLAAERGLELGTQEMRERRRGLGLHDITRLQQAALADIGTRRDMLDQVGRAADAWRIMSSRIDERFGWAAVNLRAVLQMLERIEEIASTARVRRAAF